MKKIINLLLFVFTFCLQCVFIQSACCNNANKIYENNVNSIFYITTQDTTGTGIILDENGTFATCFHIIAGADSIFATSKEGRKYKVSGFKYINPDDDIAILTISSKNKFKPVIKAKNSNFKIGDNIYTIGNPKQIKFVLNNGIINKIINKNTIQFSAPSSPGSSGSALFNESGELIGMVVGQLNPSKFQNINFAVSNSLFIPYLSKSTKINTKHLPWSDFVALKSSNKNLKQYIKYAIDENDEIMLYKYLKHIISSNEIPASDYALYGTMALNAYMNNYGENKSLLDDAVKWYALSINSNINKEISIFGLIQALMMKDDLTFINELEKQLKKYKKSYRFLNYCFKNVLQCPDDEKCIAKYRNELLNYLYKLNQEVYSDFSINSDNVLYNPYTNSIVNFSKALKKSQKNEKIRENLISSYILRGDYYFKEKEYSKASIDYRSALFYIKYFDKEFNNNDINTKNIEAKLKKSLKELSFDKSLKNRYYTAYLLYHAQEYPASAYEYFVSSKDKKLKNECIKNLSEIFKRLGYKNIKDENLIYIIKDTK